MHGSSSPRDPPYTIKKTVDPKKRKENMIGIYTAFTLRATRDRRDCQNRACQPPETSGDPCMLKHACRLCGGLQFHLIRRKTGRVLRRFQRYDLPLKGLKWHLRFLMCNRWIYHSLINQVLIPVRRDIVPGTRSHCVLALKISTRRPGWDWLE